jgi:hypothetical protein
MGQNIYDGNGCNQSWDPNIWLLVTHACTLKNLYVTNPSGGHDASDVAVTAWTAAFGGTLAASSLTCTAGTGTTCSDTTHTVSITAGSEVSVKIVTDGTGGGNFSVAMECD